MLSSEYQPEIFFFYLIVFVFFGAVMGSFSTAIIHRVKQGRSWVSASDGKAARSQCPKCHHVLAAKDLVPIFSWVFLKGRCRYCFEKISAQYFFLELISITLSIIIFICIGVGIGSFILLAILPFALSQIIVWKQSSIISYQLCAIIVSLVLIYWVYNLFFQ